MFGYLTFFSINIGFWLGCSFNFWPPCVTQFALKCSKCKLKMKPTLAFFFIIVKSILLRSCNRKPLLILVVETGNFPCLCKWNLKQCVYRRLGCKSCFHVIENLKERKTQLLSFFVYCIFISLLSNVFVSSLLVAPASFALPFPQAIVDTGKTMKALLKHVEAFEPKMVKVAGWDTFSVLWVFPL